jgi:hypothetical protein
MEHKSLWKNFLLLTVVSLLVFHMKTSNAADTDNSDSSSDATDSCVLEE